MSKVIVFSRHFPNYHPKAGQPTYFIEKIWESLAIQGKDEFSYTAWETLIRSTLTGWKQEISNECVWAKHHTIRAGHRWKAGDYFSPRVWSGRPYKSKQIAFCPDIKIERTFDFEIQITDDLKYSHVLLNGAMQDKFLVEEIAKNDGLEFRDFLVWLEYPKSFDGQVICWNSKMYQTEK